MFISGTWGIVIGAVGDFISGRNMLGLPASTAVTGLSSLPPGHLERAVEIREREIAIAS
jgi:hypothetical protein